LGISAKTKETRGADRVSIRENEAIGALLTRMGAQQSRLEWEEQRQRREVRSPASRLANFDDANLRRAARAAEEIEDAEGIAVASGPIDPETGKARRFSYAPGLVVVDGGLPQVNAARAVLDELGIDVPLIGLAKRLEEIWVPGEEFPVILPRTSPALYLLQHLRDESHRFAITHHRKKRSAGMTRSVLDGIPGLGPARQAALLREFGSVTRIRQAEVDDITRIKGIGPALAGTILAHLNSPDTQQ